MTPAGWIGFSVFVGLALFAIGWVAYLDRHPRRRRVDEGRRLASERDDLIAQGVDPADLLVPLFVDEKPRRHRPRHRVRH